MRKAKIILNHNNQRRKKNRTNNKQDADSRRFIMIKKTYKIIMYHCKLASEKIELIVYYE